MLCCFSHARLWSIFTTEWLVAIWLNESKYLMKPFRIFLLFLFCKINVCLQALSCSASTHFYDRWLIFLLWLDSLHLLPFKSTKSLEIPSLALRIRFSRWFEAICRTTWEISKRKLFTRLTNKFSFRYLHCKWLVDFLTTLWCASQSIK